MLHIFQRLSRLILAVAYLYHTQSQTAWRKVPVESTICDRGYYMFDSSLLALAPFMLAYAIWLIKKIAAT